MRVTCKLKDPVFWARRWSHFSSSLPSICCEAREIRRISLYVNHYANQHARYMYVVGHIF